MLANIFYKLLNMSFVVLLFGVIIIVIRYVFDKKIPPIWKCALWVLVILSLCIPFKLQTHYAIGGSNKMESEVNERIDRFLTKEDRDLKSPDLEQDSSLNGAYQSRRIQGEIFEKWTKSEDKTWSKDLFFNRYFIVKNVIPGIWLGGVLTLFLFFSITRLKLSSQFKVDGDTKKGTDVNEERERVERILDQCKKSFDIKRPINFSMREDIGSPAIIGVFHPRILVPTFTKNMSEESLSYVIYHELAHYKRGDTLLHSFLLILQIIYWFNPLLIFLFKAIREDMELLTDCYVLERIGEEHSKSYSKSLLEVLAHANNIPFMPKALCMVDGKKNIERRIKMIKVGEAFKKNKILISILCILFIVVGGIALFTSQKKDHNIEIYAIKGLYDSKTDYEGLIKDKEPVLTEKDIAGYNKETKMLFISEDKVKEYWDYILNTPESQRKYDISGGSFFLGIEGDGVYIIKLDGELLIEGPLQRPFIVSTIPSGLFVKDGSEGLRFVYDFFDDKNLVNGKKDELKDLDHNMELLADAFDDMDLLTEDVFDLRNRELSIDTNKVYENRTEYVGDNSKVGGIISNLLFPQGLKYKNFSIESEKEPYGLTIHLDYEGKKDLKKEMVFKKYNEAFELNSKILFALVGNLEKISYEFDSQPEIYGIEYKAIYGDREEDFMVVEKNRVFNTTRKLFEESSSILDFYRQFSGYIELDRRYGGNKEKEREQKEEETKKTDQKEKDQKEKGGNDELVYPKPLEVQLNTILEKIASGPKTSSNPKDYIKEHPEEYYQLKIMLSTEKKLVDQEFKNDQGTLKGKIIEEAERELTKDPLFLFITDTGIEINARGDEERELSKEELEDVNRAFRLLKYDASLDKQVVNPICHVLSSHFKDPKDIDLAALVRYMPGQRLQDQDDQHRRIFESLKKNKSFPFKKDKKIEDMPVPLREIFEEDVDMLLFNFLGMNLEDTNWVGKEEALYLDEFTSFYSYSSDFGLNEFRAKSGGISKNQVVLESDYETLVIEKFPEKGNWYIVGFSK